MERQTRLFLFCVTLIVCSATVGAEVFTIVADFEETKTGDTYGYMTGKLYYKYDSETRTNSRLRLEYNVGKSTVNNLYDYGAGAMYSMCDVCTGILITDLADPWYKDNNFYTKEVPSAKGVTWYSRTKYGIDDKTFAQVSRIRMNDKGGSQNTIEEIYFADGRHFILSGLQHTTVDENKFKVDSNLNCPKATCPIYADLIFVLDNSGSVKDGSWNEGIKFVKDVIDSFTFGEDAVEGAVIQFNAPYYSKSCDKSTINGCEMCKNDFTYYTQRTGCDGFGCTECEKYSWAGCSKYKTEYYNYPGYATATIFAGKKDNSGNFYTVTPDPENGLKKNLGTRPSKVGDTCQGYGLELAMQVLDKSPRRAYENKPQPIIIAVTDGEDHCPNKTADAAQKLRDVYGAFVVEVGVGLNSGCTVYATDFLKRIASKAGSDDNPAYYDVSDYSAIHTITEKLFKPLCSDFSSQCGPDCRGFCGCGKCFCPQCRDPGSACINVTCFTDDKMTSSTGCVGKDIVCSDPDVENCDEYRCNPSASDPGSACEHVDLCADLREANNKYECRSVSCDTYDGCKVSYDDEFCQNKYAKGDKCVTFKCSRTDDQVEEKYKDTGCYVSENKTRKLEEELENSGKIGCFIPKCDPKKGLTFEEDVCPSRLNNTVCYSSECLEVETKKFECVDFAEGRSADTYCTRYECSGTDGWVPVTITSDADCKDEITQHDETLEKQYRCFKITCSDEYNKCIAENMIDCNDICTQEIIDNCTATSTRMSTPEKCYNFKCKEYKVDEENWIGRCNDEVALVNFTNCLNTELYVNITKNNTQENATECCSVICSKSKCEKTCTLKPSLKSNYKTNYCVDFNCTYVSEGQWEWVEIDSENVTTCFSNDCWTRECVPSQGCINITEICESQSNECVEFTCNETTLTCSNKSLLKEKSECTEEICENGKIKVLDRIEWCTEVENNKCIDRKCVYNKTNRSSTCEYFDTKPAEMDDCLNYTCNNLTGEWTGTPKCDDGIYCTENVCTIFGECKFPDITCSELSMEGYSCFERRCKEDPKNSNYLCYRKLIRNAYVDICGNCIIEEGEGGSSSSSASASSNAEFNCANAPPKPLLTEGLAAASIALIILAAVVIGAGVAASGVMGTKTLISRAKSANNTSAHTNPLFENADTEMTNPAFAGTAI